MSESPARLGKTQIAEPTPRVSDTAGLGWDPGSRIPHKLSSDGDAAGLGPSLRTGSYRVVCFRDALLLPESDLAQAPPWVPLCVALTLPVRRQQAMQAWHPSREPPDSCPCAQKYTLSFVLTPDKKCMLHHQPASEVIFSFPVCLNCSCFSLCCPLILAPFFLVQR